MFAGKNIKLKYEDALAIRQRFPELTVAPVVNFEGQLKIGERDFSGRITGTSPEYSEMRNFFPEEGRFLNPTDLQEWRRSVVLGKTVAEVLFGTESPIGKEVKIFGGVKKIEKKDATKGEKKKQEIVEEYRFMVVGVMQPKGEIHGRRLG